MYKNKNEVKAAQIFNRIQEHLYFKSDDLKEITKSERMAYLYLKRWLEQGLVQKFPFNIYSPIDAETGLTKVNLFEAVCQIHEKTYLCEFTAARYHGLIVPDDNRIYIASVKRFRELTYEQWEIKYKRYLLLENCVKLNEARYSSYTQTVLDIINAFSKNMALEEFCLFLKSIKMLETKKVIKILIGVNNRILNKKIGWLVDDGWLDVDEKDILIEFCLEQNTMNKLMLCSEAKENGIYNQKWGLMIPKDIL